MSNRTLVELNHDFAPGRSNQALAEWAARLADYMRSGDPSHLPYGVTFKHRRHHSEPDPMESAELAERVARADQFGKVKQ